MDFVTILIFFGFLILVLYETKEKILGIFFFISIAMASQVIGIYLFQHVFPSQRSIVTLFLFDISIAGIWVGIRIYKLLFSKKPPLPKTESENTKLTFPISFRWLMVFVFVLIIILFYSFVDYYIPLLTANSQIAKLQFAAGRGIYMRLFKTFIPITAMFILAHILAQKPTMNKKFLGITAIIILIILSFFTAYKAWPAYVLILMFLYYYYTKKHTNPYYFLTTILFSIITALGITYFAYRTNIGNTSLLLLGRMTQNQVLPVIKCVEIAERDGFRMGSTFTNDIQYLLGTLRIGERPDKVFAVELYDRLYGSNPNNFTAPPGLVGELFVNFGFIGLFLFSLVFGFFVYILHRKTIYSESIQSKIYLLYLLYTALFMVFGGTVIGTLEDLGISMLLFIIVWNIYLTVVRLIDTTTVLSTLSNE